MNCIVAIPVLLTSNAQACVSGRFRQAEKMVSSGASTI
jgi:hypothetical protein